LPPAGGAVTLLLRPRGCGDDVQLAYQPDIAAALGVMSTKTQARHWQIYHLPGGLQFQPAPTAQSSAEAGSKPPWRSPVSSRPVHKDRPPRAAAPPAADDAPPAAGAARGKYVFKPRSGLLGTGRLRVVSVDPGVRVVYTVRCLTTGQVRELNGGAPGVRVMDGGKVAQIDFREKLHELQQAIDLARKAWMPVRDTAVGPGLKAQMTAAFALRKRSLKPI
jgi:hypothetical protein